MPIFLLSEGIFTTDVINPFSPSPLCHHPQVLLYKVTSNQLDSIYNLQYLLPRICHFLHTPQNTASRYHLTAWPRTLTAVHDPGTWLWTRPWTLASDHDLRAWPQSMTWEHDLRTTTRNMNWNGAVEQRAWVQCLKSVLNFRSESLKSKFSTN